MSETGSGIGGDASRGSRELERRILGVETSDGAGVRLWRVLGQDLQRRLDPFLMLDVFRSDDPQDYLAGFPEHPHRGFETITYMLAGRMRHRDSSGHEGLLTPGSMQWMTAARGIVHSELPEQQDGLMEGFQIWLNLPAAHKLDPPAYRDFRPDEIPLVEPAHGVRVRVLAGRFGDTIGAVQRPDTDPQILDLTLAPGAQLRWPLDPLCSACAYVYRGLAGFGTRREHVARDTMAILETATDKDSVFVASEHGASVLLLAARPLREPIAQYGPFVMNTHAELEQALEDLRQGRFVGA